MESWVGIVASGYDLSASVMALLAMVAITLGGKFIAFRIPALARMREINQQRDAEKLKTGKYQPILEKSKWMGLVCNLVFFLMILPFVITTESVAIWKVLVDVVVILMFYDFFYYLVHRFWFHGSGPMRRIHALHHQARQPTYIDAQYVHPLETLTGLAILMGSVVVLAALFGQFHIASIVVMYVLYTQLNTINHTFVDLPYFPFKTLSSITKKHHIHHENMQMGNYASLSMVYDKLFGTLD